MNIKNNLFKKDKNSTLGFIRISCSTIGSLVIAYLILMLFAKTLNFSIFENIVLCIIILPILWSFIGLLIVLSNTKLIAILKTIIPIILLLLTLKFIG